MLEAMTFKTKRPKRVSATELVSSDSVDQADPGQHEMSLALPVVGGLFVYALLTGFLFAQPHGDLEWFTWFVVVTKAVQGFMVTYGWTALGLAAALLAAALTAVSIVGYRSSPMHLPVKLESIRNTVETLIYSAAALASLIAVGYFSSVTSLLLFSDAVEALEPSSPNSTNAAELPLLPAEADNMVHHLEHTFASLLLGLCAFLLVVCAGFLMRTVSIWFATDSEVHASERALLAARIEHAQERIAELEKVVGNISQLGTAVRAYFLTGLMCVLLAALIGAFIGSRVGNGNSAVFAGVAAGLTLYLIVFAITPAMPLMATSQRGALVHRIKGKPGAAKVRWRFEIVAWSVGLCFMLVPAALYAWYFTVNASVGPFLALLPLVAALTPLVLGVFLVPARFSWRGIAAHSARKELSGYLAADTQRLSLLRAIPGEAAVSDHGGLLSLDTVGDAAGPSFSALLSRHQRVQHWLGDR